MDDNKIPNTENEERKNEDLKNSEEGLSSLEKSKEIHASLVEEQKSQMEILQEEKERIEYEKGLDEMIDGAVLTKAEIDVIGEVGNIAFGSAATALSNLLNQKVSITTPVIDVVNADDVEEDEIPHVVLNVNYVKGLNMKNLLIIETKVASIIADLMMGGSGQVDDEYQIGEMELSAVQEAMNQMMGTAATSMSEVFGRMVDISPPTIKSVTARPEHIENAIPENWEKYVRISFELNIGGFIQSKLVQVISVDEAKEMARYLIAETQEDVLTQSEKDVLGEIANMSFGAASTALSAVLSNKVTITTPNIEVVNVDSVGRSDREKIVVSVNYTKGLDMENLFIIDKRVANVMADLMMGGNGETEEKDLTEMEFSAVQEAMNQMMGASATAMSEVFQELIDISPPKISVEEPDNELNRLSSIEGSKQFVKISFDLNIGGFLESKLEQLISIEKAKGMAKKLLVSEEEVLSSMPEIAADNGEEALSSAVKVEKSVEEKSKVSPLLKDVKVKVEVIFGNTVKSLKEILAMESDDIVALSEEVKEPLKVYANGILVAEGEIANVDGFFGIEIKNVLYT